MSAPSHAFCVPPLDWIVVRCVGGFTHRKLELPVPQVGYKVSRTQVRVVATDPAGNVAVQEGWV